MERDQILMTFQEITDTEDTGFAVEILERLNWDLEMAVNHVFTHGHELPEKLSNPTESTAGTNLATPGQQSSSLVQTDLLGSRVTTSATRPCDFRADPLDINGMLDSYIASPSSPASNGNSPTDNNGFSFLSSNMPGTINNHQLQSSSSALKRNREQSPNKLNSKSVSEENLISIEITHDDTMSGMTLKKVFKFSEKAMVIEVKNKAATSFLVPLRQQKWKGWPSNTDEADFLSSLGLSNPHKLELIKMTIAGREYATTAIDNLLQTGTSLSRTSEEGTSAGTGDFEDMEIDESHSQMILGAGERLLEDASPDDLESQEKFMKRFRDRYGETHPTFYLGNFAEAIESSCGLPASDRKLLAIYAHHDRSVFANVFCETILCSEHVLNILNSNFVFWGWDCTLDSNKKLFFDLLSKHFGPATIDLSKRNHKQYPILIFIGKQNGMYDILQVISGSQTLDEVAATMMNSYEQFAVVMAKESKQDRERASQQRLLSEQNQAYLESLAADRAKEELRKKEEQEKKQESDRREKREAEKAKRKEEQKDMFTQQLQPEPDESFKSDVTNVRIRTPTNETLTRKFVADSELTQLFAFVASIGYFPDNYRIMTSWPRQELSYEKDKEKSFRAKELTPTATLLIERKLK